MPGESKESEDQLRDKRLEEVAVPEKKEAAAPVKKTVEGDEADDLEEEQLEEKKKVVEEHDEKKEELVGIASREVDDLMAQVNSFEVFVEEGQVNIEKVKEFAAFIPVDVLYQLEDKRPGTLLDAFSEKEGDNNYSIDFRNNKEAENTLGLNILFSHMPEVRSVKVEADSKHGNKVENGVRHGVSGSFYQGSEYVEVLSGYKVTVVEVLDKESNDYKKLQRRHEQLMNGFDKVLKPVNKKKFEGFFNVVSQDKYSDVNVEHVEQGENLQEKLLYRIFEVSANNDVDPYLTMSLLMAENGDNGKYFGVLMEGVSSFESQLDWAVKLIAKAEISYKSSSKKDPYNVGHYSVNFLSYFSEIYSPLEEGNKHHFDNIYENYFKFRGIPPLDKLDLKKRHDNGLDLAKKSRESSVMAALTPEQIDALNERIKNLGAGDRILAAVDMFTNPANPNYTPIKGDHCWDWVDKVYTAAGFGRSGRQRIFQDLNYSGRNCGNHHAGEDLLDRLQPGDWLYINNKNGFDSYGNHSVVFLGWEDEDRRIAKTASCHRSGRSGEIDNYNLVKSPVTHISKPTV